MNSLNQPTGGDRLGPLLRQSRPEPGLPPRFQENVWRRIDRGDARQQTTTWIESLAGLFLRPRFALTTVAILLLTGALLGTWNGTTHARLVAQERYVAAVAMPAFP